MRKHLSNLRQKMLLVLAFLILAIFIYKIFMFKSEYGFFPIFSETWYFFKKYTEKPVDLYQPIILDSDFKFTELGFSKVYEFKPKYLGIHAIAIQGERKVFPQTTDGIFPTYKFKGKIQVEFFHGSDLIREDFITMSKQITGWDTLKIYLLEFGVPVNGKYIKNLHIKLTVIEPDMSIEAFKESVSLLICVSGIP